MYSFFGSNWNALTNWVGLDSGQTISDQISKNYQNYRLSTSNPIRCTLATLLDRLEAGKLQSHKIEDLRLMLNNFNCTLAKAISSRCRIPMSAIYTPTYKKCLLHFEYSRISININSRITCILILYIQFPQKERR